MVVHALDIVHADHITPVGAQEPVRRQLLRQFVQGEMDFQFLRLAVDDTDFIRRFDVQDGIGGDVYRHAV